MDLGSVSIRIAIEKARQHLTKFDRPYGFLQLCDGAKGALRTQDLRHLRLFGIVASCDH